MSQYRPLRTGFWNDVKVSNHFTPEDKYFYLFLLTAPFGNLLGAFEFGIPLASFYLGYDQETVKRLIRRFEEIHEVIYYDHDTSEILILNYHKYNWNKSANFIKGIISELEKIKSNYIKKIIGEIIKKEYPLDTPTKPLAYHSRETNTKTNTKTNTNTSTKRESVRARTREQDTHALIFDTKLTDLLKESLYEFIKQSTLTEEQVVKMIEFILQATEIYEDQTLVIWLNQLTFEGRKIPYFDRLLNAPKKVIKGNNNNEPEWLDEYIKEFLGE